MNFKIICTYVHMKIQRIYSDSLSVVARGQGGEKEGWIAKRHKEAFEDDKNICYLSHGDGLLGGCIC